MRDESDGRSASWLRRNTVSKIVPGTSETDAEPTKRKVTLSGKDLEDARRLLTVIAAQSAPVAPAAAFPEVIWFGQQADPARDELLRRANMALENRRRRGQIFRKGMFGEPAWEMLLVLYLSDLRHPQSIGSLSEAAGVTGTTALRWLEVLEGDQLVERSEHPFDKRRVLIALTPKAREALDLYFSGTL